jgi:hypothetical protein
MQTYRTTVSPNSMCGPKFREEMEQSAQATGEGWKASVGSVEDADAFFSAWLPDAATRHWVITEFVASPQPIQTFRQAVRLSDFRTLMEQMQPPSAHQEASA